MPSFSEVPLRTAWNWPSRKRYTTWSSVRSRVRQASNSAWSFAVPVREAPDVGAGDQGAQLGGGLGPPRGQLRAEGCGRGPDLRRPEGEGTGLGLQGVGPVAVPPAGLGGGGPFGGAPAAGRR